MLIAGFEGSTVNDVRLAGYGAVAGAVLGLIALVPQMIPGEVRSGRMAFLQRMPVSLLPSFLSKVVVLLASLSLHTLNALVAVEAVRAVLAPEAPRGWMAFEHPIPEVILAVFAFGLWTLSVSCWMTRSVLAVPGAALLLGICLAPALLVSDPLEALVPDMRTLSAMLVVLVLVSIVMGYLSYVRGLRLELSGLRAFMRGGLVLVVPIVGTVHIPLHC